MEEKKWDLRRDVTNFLYAKKVSCQECFPHSFESPMLMWTVFFESFISKNPLSLYKLRHLRDVKFGTFEHILPQMSKA